MESPSPLNSTADGFNGRESWAIMGVYSARGPGPRPAKLFKSILKMTR